MNLSLNRPRFFYFGENLRQIGGIFSYYTTMGRAIRSWCPSATYLISMGLPRLAMWHQSARRCTKMHPARPRNVPAEVSTAMPPLPFR